MMNCLFKVRTKATRKTFEVYDVRSCKGYTEFLVCINGEWRYELAQLFEPIVKGGAE